MMKFLKYCTTGMFCLQSSFAFTTLTSTATKRSSRQHNVIITQEQRPSSSKYVLREFNCRNGNHAIESSSSSALFMTTAPGDKLRESTGKRPSLNPTIINTISEALSLRANGDASLPMEPSDTVEPLQVAMAAGKLATGAIEKRAKSSSAVEGDESSAFTQEESQLIAGRMLGVVMRWDELERILVERVKGTAWVTKYGEEASFGVLADECKDEGCDENALKQRLKDDPLFRMCRAECLYALFLNDIEMPAMAKVGQVAPDASKGIDFIDSDRSDVLFSNDI
jgi:hypothetical protein